MLSTVALVLCTMCEKWLYLYSSYSGIEHLTSSTYISSCSDDAFPPFASCLPYLSSLLENMTLGQMEKSYYCQLCCMSVSFGIIASITNGSSCCMQKIRLSMALAQDDQMSMGKLKLFSLSSHAPTAAKLVRIMHCSIAPCLILFG